MLCARVSLLNMESVLMMAQEMMALVFQVRRLCAILIIESIVHPKATTIYYSTVM